MGDAGRDAVFFYDPIAINLEVKELEEIPGGSDIPLKTPKTLVASASLVKGYDQLEGIREYVGYLADGGRRIRRMEREQMEQENAKREQKRIARELEVARQIQVGVLPQTFPAFPDRDEFDLFASMTPAKEVGGDFYDFLLIDADHLALVIADVSEKGIPAAMFMMASRTLIRNELMTGCDPATAMQQANVQLCERNESGMFVTVWLAVLEISTGRGVAYNAGHENPGLRRAGGEFELLEYRHNLFVGALARAKYQNREFELHPGDCLFVYTDGVPEANNVSEKMFGEERLLDALSRHADASPEELVHTVREAIDQFTGDAPQFDDITMLCLRMRDV